VQERTSQCTIGRNSARKDGTVQERTEQCRTGPDRAGQDGTAHERTGQDRTGQDRTGQDRTGQDRTRRDSAGNDETGRERTRHEEKGQNKTGTGIGTRTGWVSGEGGMPECGLCEVLIIGRGVELSEGGPRVLQREQLILRVRRAERTFKLLFSMKYRYATQNRTGMEQSKRALDQLSIRSCIGIIFFKNV
jgi:hypothetical protein